MGPENFSSDKEKIAAAEAAKKSDSGEKVPEKKEKTKDQESKEFDPDKFKHGVIITPAEERVRELEELWKAEKAESFSDKVKRLDRENKKKEQDILDRHRKRLKDFDEKRR